MFDRKLALAIERLVCEKGVLGLVLECNLIGEARNSYIYSSEIERDKHQKVMESEGWERQEDKLRYTLSKGKNMDLLDAMNCPVGKEGIKEVDLNDNRRDIRVYYAVYITRQSSDKNRTRLVEILDDIEREIDKKGTWFE